MRTVIKEKIHETQEEFVERLNISNRALITKSEQGTALDE